MAQAISSRLDTSLYPDGLHHPLHEVDMNPLIRSLVEGNLKRYGLHIQGVFPTSDSPPDFKTFTYTIGLYPELGYEILVFVLPMDLVGAYLNAIHEEVIDKGPGTIKLDVPDDRWFGSVPVMFRRADPIKVREFVVQADMYYEKEVPVVQMVFSDKHGKFPGCKDYDARFGAMQPLMF